MLSGFLTLTLFLSIFSHSPFFLVPQELLMFLEYQGHTSATSGSLHFLLPLPEMVFLRYPQNLLPHALPKSGFKYLHIEGFMTVSFEITVPSSLPPATLHTSYSTFIIYFPQSASHL